MSRLWVLAPCSSSFPDAMRKGSSTQLRALLPASALLALALCHLSETSQEARGCSLSAPCLPLQKGLGASSARVCFQQLFESSLARRAGEAVLQTRMCPPWQACPRWERMRGLLPHRLPPTPACGQPRTQHSVEMRHQVQGAACVLN